MGVVDSSSDSLLLVNQKKIVYDKIIPYTLSRRRTLQRFNLTWEFQHESIELKPYWNRDERKLSLLSYSSRPNRYLIIYIYTYIIF